MGLKSRVKKKRQIDWIEERCKLPSWEVCGELFFSSEVTIQLVSVYFKEDVDWTRVLAFKDKLLRRYEASNTHDHYFTNPSRSISLQPRKLSLSVRGTRQQPPAHDDGIQSAILAGILASASDLVAEVGRDRIILDPRDNIDSGESKIKRKKAIALLNRYVHNTAELRIGKLDYWKSNNPEVSIRFEGERTVTRKVRNAGRLSVRPGLMTVWVDSCVFSFQQYESHLGGYYKDVLFTSNRIELAFEAGESITVQIRLQNRSLSAAEKRFFAQRAEDTIHPPPAPRQALVIETAAV